MTPFQTFSSHWKPERRPIIEKALTIGMHLIKQFEGCRLRAYRCPAGIWTIGWGHTGNITQGEQWTQDKADQVLKEDIVSVAKHVICSAPHLLIHPNRFGACISLTYNIGSSAFARSTLSRLIRVGRWNMAADAFKSWRYVNRQENQGLIRRRAIERQVFLKDSESR